MHRQIFGAWSFEFGRYQISVIRYRKAVDGAASVAPFVFGDRRSAESELGRTVQRSTARE